jgi:hypothetical protein
MFALRRAVPAATRQVQRVSVRPMSGKLAEELKTAPSKVRYVITSRDVLFQIVLYYKMKVAA